MLNVLNSENKNLNLSCSFEEIVFFQNLVLKIWGRSSKGEDKGLIQIKVDVPLFCENGKIIPIYLLYLLYRCYVVKCSNSNIILYVGDEAEFISVLLSSRIFPCHAEKLLKKVSKNSKVFKVLKVLKVSRFLMSISFPCTKLLYLLGVANDFNHSDNYFGDGDGCSDGYSFFFYSSRNTSGKFMLRFCNLTRGLLKVTISDEQAKRNIIDVMLVRQGVESNPGLGPFPGPGANPINIFTP